MRFAACKDVKGWIPIAAKSLIHRSGSKMGKIAAIYRPKMDREPLAECLSIAQHCPRNDDRSSNHPGMLFEFIKAQNAEFCEAQSIAEVVCANS